MIANSSPAPSGPQPGSPAWWRARHQEGVPAGRPRANGLSLERIFEAAVTLIEAEGLEGVTMRRIAEVLDTGPASLYRHVSGRDELLVLLADRLLPDALPAPKTAPDWRAGCEQIAHSYRKLLLGNPALALLAAQGQMLGPNSLRGREHVLRWLIGEGFSPSLAARTYLLLTRYVIGSIHTYGRSAKQHADERKELIRLFKALDPDEFPTVVALADELGGQRPSEEFEFGLAALLDGLAAAREREKAGR
jgi:AcrR family transcriptional regulator